jgi:hypothetical protein
MAQLVLPFASDASVCRISDAVHDSRTPDRSRTARVLATSDASAMRRSRSSVRDVSADNPVLLHWLGSGWYARSAAPLAASPGSGEHSRRISGPPARFAHSALVAKMRRRQAGSAAFDPVREPSDLIAFSDSSSPQLSDQEDFMTRMLRVLAVIVLPFLSTPAVMAASDCCCADAHTCCCDGCGCCEA